MSDGEFDDFTDTFTTADGTEVEIEFMDGSDLTLMVVVKPNGITKLHAHVPPYVTVAILARLAQRVANDNGLHVPDCVKRFQIEAAHGPLGHASDN